MKVQLEGKTFPNGKFVEEAKKGGKGNLPIDGTMEIVKTEAWDGKDGEVVDADEFSLEELMGNDDNTEATSTQ
ncbi:Protein disulfide-isomerase like 2-2 [Cardamine amara subsp. amara]|uniref:Protein disulfide-isomerase like 2-2 n=1 Tax=Cardamine amara subsp. amara TaxID=228776 RepID=A0ABD1AS21_CARAN